MTIKVNLTNEEYLLASDYAKSKGLTLREALKTIFFEKIEDEYDVSIAESALRDYEKNPKTYSHEEVKKMLDI